MCKRDMIVSSNGSFSYFSTDAIPLDGKLVKLTWHFLTRSAILYFRTKQCLNPFCLSWKTLSVFYLMDLSRITKQYGSNSTKYCSYTYSIKTSSKVNKLRLIESDLFHCDMVYTKPPLRLCFITSVYWVTILGSLKYIKLWIEWHVLKILKVRCSHKMWNDPLLQLWFS